MNVNNKDNITRLKNLISQNNGRITSKEVTEAGIHRMYLKELVDDGFLVKTARGLYQKGDTLEDELYDLQTRYSVGIYSFETALYLHDLLERVPFTWTMTFKSSYHSESIKNENVLVKYSCEKLYPLEIETVLSPSGNNVLSYSAERTLCEILKFKSDVDIQVIIYAIKTYANQKNKNIPKIMELAKLFHVETELRHYLEILL